jgi:alpha-glucosidase
VSDGKWIKADAPLDRIPVFVSGGAVIPMLETAPQNTDKLAPKKIELHVFVPEGDGEMMSMLQEDDGLTFDADQNKFVRTVMRLTRKGDRTLLEARVFGDGYEGFARTQFEVFWHTCRGVDQFTVDDSGQGFSVFGTEHAEGSNLMVVNIKSKKKWFGRKK